MKAAESVDGEEKRETSRTSLGGLVEVSREVLTRLSALAWVEQRRPLHVCNGGPYDSEALALTPGSPPQGISPEN